MLPSRSQVVLSIFLRCTFGVPHIVARYSSAIRPLFVRYLFGSEPDKYRTSNAHVPNKNDGKSLPAPWGVLGCLLPTVDHVGCKYTKKIPYYMYFGKSFRIIYEMIPIYD